MAKVKVALVQDETSSFIQNTTPSVRRDAILYRFENRNFEIWTVSRPALSMDKLYLNGSNIMCDYIFVQNMCHSKEGIEEIVRIANTLEF